MTDPLQYVLVWTAEPESLAGVLQNKGAVSAQPLLPMPAVAVQASADDLRVMLELPGVVAIRKLDEASMENRSTRNAVRPEFPRSAWSTYHSESLCNYGDDIEIGLFEAYGDLQFGSRVLEKHTAFEWPTQPGSQSISYYQTNPMSCSVNGDCESICGPFASEPERCICYEGSCVSPHLTGVLARIGSYHHCPDPAAFLPIQHSYFDQTFGVDIFDCQPGFMGAAKAKFSVANNRGNNATLQQDLANTNDAYAYLTISQSTDIINESWGPKRLNEPGGAYTSPQSWRAALADYYARKYQVTIVQAAGDDAGGGQGVNCDGYNTICVGGLEYSGSLNMTDYNHDEADYGLTTTSHNENPSIQTGLSSFRALKTSKPDAVASSVGAHIPVNHNGPGDKTEDAPSAREFGPGGDVFDLWRADGAGTSFAAPVVTGVIAQFLRARAHARDYTNAEIRAILHAGGVFQPFYAAFNQGSCLGLSTPAFPTSKGCDFDGGIGPLTAGTFYHFGIQDKSFCSGGTPGPSPCPYPPEICSGVSFVSDGGFMGPNTEFTSLPGAAQGIPMGPPHIALNGFAIRSALSYYSCPATTGLQYVSSHAGAFTKESELAVSTDLDVGLYARNGSDPWTLLKETSGTDEETNEGLWYSSSDSWEEVQVFVIRRDPWTPCGAVFNPEGLGAGEPYGYAEVFFDEPIALP